MVKGDNKGHKYEKKIVQILKDKKLMPTEVAGAGSGPGIDAFFLHQGKEYSIEVKNRANGAEFGQKRLIPEKKGKEWRWNWAPKVMDEKITKYYTKIGVLDYLDKKKIIPNKYRKVDSELTYQDVKEDQKNFEDVTYYISDETIGRFYEDKADYIQIGNGYGLYHPKTDKAKLGTEKLSDTLSKILINNIKRSIPSIMIEINKLDNELDILIENLGPPLPTEDDAKMSFLHIILAEICREFTSILDERSASHNIGRTIKDVLIEYRQQIDTIDPFTKEEFNDNYIINCIKNSEGNHMSFPIPSIEVFEHCIREPNKKPINVLIEPSMECLSGVCEQFSCMLDILLEKEHIARFPNLVRRIKNEIFTSVMRKNRDNTSNKIIDMIEMESNYIWTDQKKFNEQLSTIFNQKGILEPSNMRKLLSLYFSTIKDSMKNNIPKIIMLFLVKKTKESVASILFDNFTKPPLGNLLDEPNGIGEKRKIYQDQKIKVVSIKRALESIQ